MELTKDWQMYDHNYQKRVQDIMMKDGEILIQCWPNAGKWVQLNEDSDRVVNDSEVYKVRLNKYEL